MDQVPGQGTKRGQRRGKLPCRGTGGLPPGWWWSGECTTAVPSCSSDRSPLESGEEGESIHNFSFNKHSNYDLIWNISV